MTLGAPGGLQRLLSSQGHFPGCYKMPGIHHSQHTFLPFRTSQGTQSWARCPAFWVEALHVTIPEVTQCRGLGYSKWG